MLIVFEPFEPDVAVAEVVLVSEVLSGEKSVSSFSCSMEICVRLYSRKFSDGLLLADASLPG